MQHTLNRPQRWDNPFDPNLADKQVGDILSLPLFSEMDPGRFPGNLPIEGIVRNDMRIRNCQEGDILVRAGDYGNSAFLVLAGSVNVVLPPGLPSEALGHANPKKNSWFVSIKRYLKKSIFNEVRLYGNQYLGSDTGLRGQGGDTQVYLKDPAAIKQSHSIVTLGEGELFGEVAALARTPRNATVFAGGNVRVLEIRWQGLRDMRRYIDSFRGHIDRLYRDRNLITHLKEITIFNHLNDDQLKKVAAHTLFESYGNFDWHASFKRTRSKGETPEEESVIVEQGDYPDGLLFVRSGFARMTRKINNGKKTVSVMSNGDIFGLEELLFNSKENQSLPYQHGLSALGYADILRVPTFIIEELVIPDLPDSVRRKLRLQLKSETQDPPHNSFTNYSDFLEFSVENRYINGTATMMIDLERCTRCDECVHACANSHQGNPRFIRHGKRHGRYMVANACMHCVDPVCMIGCPTGAIHRSTDQGEVVINDVTCIGCGTCANSCPYDNIRMVEIRESGGEVLVDQSTKTPIMKATKCDLCFDLPGGPACERACPHDALTRIDMRDNVSLTDWLNR